MEIKLWLPKGGGKKIISGLSRKRPYGVFFKVAKTCRVVKYLLATYAGVFISVN